MFYDEAKTMIACSEDPSLIFELIKEVKEFGLPYFSNLVVYHDSRGIGLGRMLMEYILNNDILTCSKAKVSKYITYELEKVLKQYLNVYVENVSFKSLYLLKDIENIKGADKGE